MFASLVLAVRGRRGPFRLLFRIIFVRLLFHTFGFAGGIAVLVAVVLIGALLIRRAGRRRGPWP